MGSLDSSGAVEIGTHSATTITTGRPGIPIATAGGARLLPLAAPPPAASGATLYADAAGRVAWVRADTFVRTLDDSALTASQVYAVPDASGTVVLDTAVQTLTNKTITSSTNTVAANQLQTTGAAVVVGGAAPPAAGQVLTATSPTAATWQTPGAAVAATPWFGTGVDGAAVIAVNTSLTRDTYYNTLTVNTGVVLNTAGFRLFVADTLTLAGTARISYNGNAGSNGAGGGGAGGPALAGGSLGGGGAGGAGGAILGAGVAGGSVPALTQLGGNGGAGGTGNLGLTGGGAGGTSTPPAAANGGSLVFSDVLRAVQGRDLGNTLMRGGNGGGGGGGGALATGGGGGGGGGGGVVMVAAKTVTGTGTITATGGIGGNGGAAVATAPGGGGGGGGGVAVLVYNALAGGFSTASVTAAGGAGGTASLGGGAGTTGAAGQVFIFKG